MSIGIHIIADFYNCPSLDALDGEQFITCISREAAMSANANVLGCMTYKFKPQGVTCLLLLSESHLSIHTWPEHKFVSMDIFTCGSKCNPAKAIEYLKRILLPEDCKIRFIKRGDKV